MKNLNHAYCYYDNRKMKTQFAQASFVELETAYKNLSSGGSLKLWLYLLHKISGRTPYDREYKERLPYRLGIQQIEDALKMSRASIYRAFSDLQRHGLVSKMKTTITKDSDNIIVFLSIPNLNNENNSEENPTNKDMSRSQKRDPQIEEKQQPKGNLSKNADLKNETMILQPTKLITPYIPHTDEGENTNKNKTVKEENLRQFAEDQIGNKNTKRNQEIERIMIALSNCGYGSISEREFSNVYSYLKKNENVSNRKTYIREAITLHNQRIEVQTHVHQSQITAHAQGENLGGAVRKFNEEDAHNLIAEFINGDYIPSMHKSFFGNDNWFSKYPSVMKKLIDWRDSSIKNQVTKEHQPKEKPEHNPFTKKNQSPNDLIKNLTDKFTKE